MTDIAVADKPMPYAPAGAALPLKTVAEALVARIAELLHAPVTVIDAHGIVVASSNPHLVGLGRDSTQFEQQQAYLRVPLRINDQPSEVIVGQPMGDEFISPRLAQALMELVTSQTAAVERLARGDQPALKNRFIHDLLHGLLTDETVIMREAKLLGLSLALPRAVILIDATAYVLADADEMPATPTDIKVQRRIQTVIDSIVKFFDLPNDTICAYIGDGEVAVLKASDTKSLEHWADRTDASDVSNPSWTNLRALKRAGAALLARLDADTGVNLSIGIGRHHPGIQGLARSYQDARAALSLGRRFQTEQRVHCLDELGIAAFVAVPDESTKIELSMYLLSPLDQSPELLETLNAFFAQDCSPSATAHQLSIHRNTLSHRLDKITALTGFDPRHFDDAVQIRLALLLHELRNHS